MSLRATALVRGWQSNLQYYWRLLRAEEHALAMTLSI